MKNILPYLMLLLFLGILAGSTIYLAKRISWALSIDHIRWLYISLGILPLLLFTLLFSLSNTVKPLLSILYILAALGIGFILYLLLSSLLIDLFHLFVRIPPLYFAAATLLLTLGLSLYGVLNARNTRVHDLEVKMAGLKEEYRIMHMSDIHLGHFRGKAYLEKLVKLTNEAGVDFLLITGDLFDGRIKLEKETLAPLATLDLPVYFVEGNHDGYSGLKEIKTYLRELGIRVLDNEVVMEKDLQIVGLQHMRADAESGGMHASQEGATMKDVLAGLSIDESKPSILLHHSPDGIQYANKAGIDLYLSGHTHAGQLFPINLINDLLFKYNKGLHDFQGTQIFVNQGAGTFGPPLRIGTRSEIVLIKLVKGN